MFVTQEDVAFSQLLLLCPDLVGQVVFWHLQAGHSKVIPIACLAEGKVMLNSSFTVFDSMEKLIASQLDLPLNPTSIILSSMSFSPVATTPSLLDLHHAIQLDKENFSFAQFIAQNESRNPKSQGQTVQDNSQPTRTPLATLSGGNRETATRNVLGQNTATNRATTATYLAPRHSQCRTPTRPPSLPQTKLCHRINYTSGTPTDEQELALYALLLAAFKGARDQAYKAHAVDNCSLLSVAKALQYLFEDITPISTVAMKNYFGRSRAPHARSSSGHNRMGRLNGRFQWDFFGEEVDCLFDKWGDQLNTMLGTAAGNDLASAKESFLAGLKFYTNHAKLRQGGKTDLPFDTVAIRSQWHVLLKAFLKWHLTPDDSSEISSGTAKVIRLTQYAAEDGQAVCNLHIDENMACTVFFVVKWSSL